MGKVFGGGSSKTTVNVPPKSDEEIALLRKQTELLETSQAQQTAAFGILEQELTKLNEAQRLAAERAAETDPIFQEVAQLELDRLRRGGRATDEERQLIQTATEAALEQGRSDIEEFRDVALQDIRDVLAPARGLRPTDQPIVDRGLQVTEESLRQFGQLERQLRETQAQSELNFPLARDALLSNIGQFQQQLGESARNFQSQLRQRSFENALTLQSLRQSGTGSLLGVAPQLLNILGQERLAQTSTTTRSNPGFFGALTSVGRLASGAGSLITSLGGIG